MRSKNCESCVTQKPREIRSLQDIKVEQCRALQQGRHWGLPQLKCLANVEESKSTIAIRNSPQGLLQVFAIQFIRLLMIEAAEKSKIFPQENGDTNYYDSLVELLEKPEFQLIASDGQNILSGSTRETLKVILLQFLNLAINSCQMQSWRQLINEYPAIISIFVGVFRELLNLGDLSYKNEELRIEQSYDFLASYFGVEISIDVQNSCAYFIKTRVHIYQESSACFHLISSQQSISEKSTHTFRSIASLAKEQYSQIDVEEFSNILNWNQHQQDELVSNCDDQTRQLQKIAKALNKKDNSQIKDFIYRDRRSIDMPLKKQQNLEQGQFVDCLATFFKPILPPQRQLNIEKKEQKQVFQKVDLPLGQKMGKQQVQIFKPQFNWQGKGVLKPSGWINKNITKEFTSSLIIQKLQEPFKSSIRAKKQKAREQRRNICSMLQFRY